MNQRDDQLRSQIAPNTADELGHVGVGITRTNSRRLLAGRGTYVDDILTQRTGHIAFVRSPLAHARIVRIDTRAAEQARGVHRVITGAQMQTICKPWRGVLSHLDMDSPHQYPLAVDVVHWQGEAVVAVVAETRALAEDAAALVELELAELPAIVGVDAALRSTERVHAQLNSNVCYNRHYETHGFEASMAGADLRLRRTLHFARHTGVPLEPRSILAQFDPGEQSLLVYQSHQAPHMMRDIFVRHFDLQANRVRVICKDVGGGFGIKVHCYPDEMAAVGAAILCGRPVKFVADRMESFSSDIHAREHEVEMEVAFHNDGTLIGIAMSDRTAIGAFSMYPRTSVMEGLGVVNYAGGPYRYEAHRSDLTILFQNKTPTSQYRAVGHPIACAAVESMIDHAARALGRDPADLRRQNLVADASQPHTSPTGLKLDCLSHKECLSTLLAVMDYEELRQQQQRERMAGRYLGIGIAVLIEMTSPGVGTYALGGAPISSQDGATVRLETDGSFTCIVSVGDQGQGTDTAMAQVAATGLGVSVHRVQVLAGDTAATPVGGGAFGSRTTAICGEAVLRASTALRSQLLQLAAAFLKIESNQLDLSHQGVVVLSTGELLLTLAELANIGYFRQDKLPQDFQPELIATRHFVNRSSVAAYTNGVQGSLIELDVAFGTVKLLRHWVVEDCGTIVNPSLVDEQIRGGVVQGLGMALFEECRYSDDGQLLTSTLADYLLPLAGDMPDIEVYHVSTPTRDTMLGAKGAGEAGAAGAPAVVMNAVNDALSPFSAEVSRFPITPQSVLEALGRV